MWGTIIIGCYNVSSTLLCNSITHYFPFDVYYSLNAMQEAHQVLLQHIQYKYIMYGHL